MINQEIMNNGKEQEKNFVTIKNIAHHFHILSPSPWPLFVSWGLFSLIAATVLVFNGYAVSLEFNLYALITVCIILGCWWRDVIRESTFENKHNPFIRRGLLIGILLFIVSEICFFGAFFWGLFHSIWVPSVELAGGLFTPDTLQLIDAFNLPLLNTLLLVSSSLTLNIAHEYLSNLSTNHNYVCSAFLKKAIFWLQLTVINGVLFLYFQITEYYIAAFQLSDTIYGTLFYILTGFHGFHVTVGTIFLIVCLRRLIASHFTANKHVGFVAAAWYWHFVDVVWLALFYFLYIIGPELYNFNYLIIS